VQNLYRTVSFGSSRTGLTTVGFRLYDVDGTAVGGRVTIGVVELGGGQYGAPVAVPDGFAGRITWDTGEPSPLSVSAAINKVDAVNTEQESLLEDIATQVSALRVAAEAVPDGIFAPPGTPPDGIVRAGIPEMDDCKILTRLKAFIVDQGVCATLEHTFRDRLGRPVNLSNWLTGSSASASASSSAQAPAGAIKVRVKEWLGDAPDAGRNPVWDIDGVAADPVGGIVRVTLEDTLVERAGIYELSFAVVNTAGRPLAVDRGLLSVEKSLFPVDLRYAREELGPPTIQEVRMRLMDSSRNENLLLDDVEFKDEQILMALWEPIRLWNETPPPIQRFTTKTFPYRGAWVSGVLAQLHLMMANHFRRNTFRGAAGGTSDKDKEREYLAEGTRLWQEYTAWLHNKKIELNVKLFAGASISSYYARGGW